MEIRIVLVEPSHPGNIGATARAMKTMDLSSLYLVNPKRFPDPQADWRAAGALDVVASAKVFDSLEDAIGDCGYVAGTSVRDRHIPWTVKSVEEFALDVAGMPEDSKPLAILFGRENNGLSNEELAMCNLHVRIPSSIVYGSLNLAMAVQILVYELFKGRGNTDVKTGWDRRHATHAEITAMYEHLDRVLNAIGFFDPSAPRTAFTRFQRMFGRIELDETEVQILRGMFTHIERAIAVPRD
ncbi:MAG: RNA methyltransferase [Gammaproteobacteria bacterium]|nr:RNA methyltransferase [Gammaproteobacteria bacterium]